MRNMLWAGAALAAAAMAVPGHAATTVVGTPVTAADDMSAGEAASDSNNGSSLGQSTILAGAFTLSAGNYLLTGLNWWGNFLSDTIGQANFTVGLYTSLGTMPADTPFYTKTFDAVGVGTGYSDAGGYEIAKYGWTPDAPGVAISGGNYFMSISANSQDDELFFWTVLDSDEHFQREAGGTNGWENRDGTVTFQATFEDAEVNPPAVPEPASWALMVLGFGVTGAALRRRRSTTIVFA